MASEQPTAEPLADWLSEATAQGIKPEQALALIGLGLMQRFHGSTAGRGEPWGWGDVDEASGADLASLRQRLDLIQLAVQTGAPLSTAEVTALLGARPGGTVVERGGLKARRLNRNVWKLSRIEESSGYGEGFRRRL
jgi:hypothetical protein